MAYETAPPGSGGRSGQAKEKAAQAAGQARQSAGEVATTAKQQAGEVVGASREQLRQATSRMRDRIEEETLTQAQRAAEVLREWSDDLEAMAERADGDSPVRDAVRRIADSGHSTADFLDQRGLGGVADELRAFAQRRPGVFLAGAALAGFAVGRLARAMAKEAKQDQAEQSGGDVEDAAPGPVRTTPRPRREEPGRYDVPPHDSPYDRSRLGEER
ncbi:hypothetical protein [Thermobifida cellulosilytica]|uniref:hypothetical protein n=1 Tax=Thermobifida cellulosilytica TaxID=144786 RepID=UPI0018DD1199|nr:hypothetical protein [Thermobifida cellulosilytica]